MKEFLNNRIQVVNNDVFKVYECWPTPTIIISDGPYGVNGYRGDLSTPAGLAAWYEPHIKKWSNIATPQTTLWFWNTEIGWATVHPILDKYGWEYKACHTWNKGMGHVAGNINTKTLTRLPVVTEICVQYVKRPVFYYFGKPVSMKEWLRAEWKRTGLPLYKANEACGVANAATRKYLTKCHLWYAPPADAFDKIVKYANEFGNHDGKPYYSIDGKTVLSKKDWEKMQAKFYCPMGVTNVWDTAQLNGEERMKKDGKAVHLNQKPLKLIELIVNISSDPDDVVWDPFGGLFTTAVACINLKRQCFSAEIDKSIFNIGVQRILTHLNNF